MDSSSSSVVDYIKEHFYGDFLEGLKEFIRIPSLAPIFDDKWQENGHLYRACDHLAGFAQNQNLKGCTITPLKDEGRSPFLIVDVAASDPSVKTSVLLYGHMDKQPFGEGWLTPPTEPVIKDGILYGRGSSDDRYAFFSSILAIKACQAQGLPHPRCVIAIEGSEEGETDDLIYYLENYKAMLGEPDLVLCLDTISISNKNLTITTSLRGIINFDLEVAISSNNIHSGLASGISPNCFNILVNVLSRIQDFQTHEVVKDLQVDIPEHRIQETKYASTIVNKASKVPFLPGVKTLGTLTGQSSSFELLLNNTWKPYLSVIGFDGLPPVARAGNVVHKSLKARLSLRLPPTLSYVDAEVILRRLIEQDSPDTYGAKITLTFGKGSNGFEAPKLPDSIFNSFREVHQQIYDHAEPIYLGGGGGIPFMEVIQNHFPKSNFLLTGALLPEGNAHAANENLDLEHCRKFTTVIALLLSKL